MIVAVIFCARTSHSQDFLDLFFFLINFSLHVLTKFISIKNCIISLAVIAGLFLQATAVAKG